MAKTVKEVADELGISKSGVRKYLSVSFSEKYTFRNANRILINDAGLEDIKKRIGFEHTHRERVNNTSQDVFNSTESARVTAVLINQLKEKDKQIERLQDLLDQSQRLQLVAENRVSDKQDKTESPNESRRSNNVDVPMIKHKRGIWAHLFNK